MSYLNTRFFITNNAFAPPTCIINALSQHLNLK